MLAMFSLHQSQVDADSSQLIDEHGRTRLFHGVNVVYKVAPFYPQLDTFDPQLSLTDKDMDDLQEWGFNVVRYSYHYASDVIMIPCRLYVAWPAVEPQRGQYNQTYLDTLASIVGYGVAVARC